MAATRGADESKRPRRKHPLTGMREIKYSDKCGKCRLQNVKIENKGIDHARTENIYWKHEVKRLEMCEIVLEGSAV